MHRSWTLVARRDARIVLTSGRGHCMSDSTSGFTDNGCPLSLLWLHLYSSSGLCVWRLWRFSCLVVYPENSAGAPLRACSCGGSGSPAVLLLSRLQGPIGTSCPALHPTHSCSEACSFDDRSRLHYMCSCVAGLQNAMGRGACHSSPRKSSAGRNPTHSLRQGLVTCGGRCSA